MRKILIIDDEESLVDSISYVLRKEDFEVISSGNGSEALDIIVSQNPDLIVLSYCGK
jgi:DNA-binding response OmpR family regulator